MPIVPYRDYPRFQYNVRYKVGITYTRDVLTLTTNRPKRVQLGITRDYYLVNMEAVQTN